MNTPSRTWAFGASLLLVGTLAACGGSDEGGTDGSGSGSPTPSATSSEQATGAALATADSSLGTILVDGQGMTIYLFTEDTQGSGASTCEDACLVAWPAVGELTAGTGVDGSLLGSITRSDGTAQATYNGWPLYYYQDDTAPGDVTGQGLQGVWWVMDAQGNAIGN